MLPLLTSTNTSLLIVLLTFLHYYWIHVVFQLIYKSPEETDIDIHSLFIY